MEYEITCPLGSKCEETRDNVNYRCRWYVQMRGQDETGKEIERWDCAIAWNPVMLHHASMTNRSIAAAIESNRNEQIKRQDAMLDLVEQGKLSA
jgi:hypothetical protein